MSKGWGGPSCDGYPQSPWRVGSCCWVRSWTLVNHVYCNSPPSRSLGHTTLTPPPLAHPTNTLDLVLDDHQSPPLPPLTCLGFVSPQLHPFILGFLFVTSSLSRLPSARSCLRSAFFLLSSVCLYMSASSLTFHSCAASVKPVISPVLTPDLFWCSRLCLRPSPHPPNNYCKQ